MFIQVMMNYYRQYVSSFLVRISWLFVACPLILGGANAPTSASFPFPETIHPATTTIAHPDNRNGQVNVVVKAIRTLFPSEWDVPYPAGLSYSLDRDQIALLSEKNTNPESTPTPAPTTSDGAIRFAVIGDFGNGRSNEARVATLVDSWNPDFVITTGDNNYPDGEAATIDDHIGQYYSQFIGNYQGSYGPGSATNHFWPSLGNHDWHTITCSGDNCAGAYFDYFTLPNNERYYEVDLGLVHLFALDSDSHEPDGRDQNDVQADWLRNQLAASTSCYNLVYFHHPPYSSGNHGSNTRMQWPFATWGADAVLNGHDHLYERLDVNGIPYFVNGAGGAGLYDFENLGNLPPEATSIVRYNQDHGAMLVTATSTDITYQFYNTDNVLVDDYTVTKNCVDDTPTPETSPTPTPTNTVTPTFTATPTNTATPEIPPSQTINVPGDAPTIQAAIDLAGDGDVVLVAPGEYNENIQLSGKTITLASQFYTTQDSSFIDQTIIDGAGNTVITVDPSVGPETQIIGFTIRDGDDGISASAKLHILNNRFTGNKDAIDYETGGGFCRNNVFEDNSDDAIDLDGPTEVTIEDNVMRNSGDDGIEARLHQYSGSTLNIIIRRNVISGSHEDGIQIIDHPGPSDRAFLIEHNLIKDSAVVGLGLMDEGESNEDLRGASISDPIRLFSNTFVDNGYGLTGGDNLIALNNIFAGSSNLALKNVDGDSIAAYNLFWGNGTDQENANVDTTNTLMADPRLDANDRLLPESPAIDAGTAFFTWQSETVLDLQPNEYSGVAPDLGAYETQVESPITNPQPPSTLLPPGTTELNLTVQSSQETTCAFSIGDALPYEEMTPFDLGAGTTVHETTLSPLDPDPNVVNDVHVRCASHPDYLLALKYRSLSQANPSYPRTGKLWGWWDLHDKGLPYMSRIDLWLAAADATADEIRALRHLNPDMLILTNINTVDGDNLPDDYYLKDIHGNRLEVWPNSFRLNLTKPYVAEYQARYAYQRMLDSGMTFDGVFFDNVFTTQAWKKQDIHGNPFLVDADEDGVEDDPDAFDAAWKAGVFHELETFRSLMPHAIVSGHAMKIYEPGIAEIFNGISMGFRTADVLEGEMIFANLWDEYHAWNELARPPHVTMIESSPPDQIAYGYDYSPWDKIPASTLEFARTYYPYFRFGLALTLMDDGYFTYEFGDTWHGNDWWYDELDFQLGYPLGPAEPIDLGVPPGEDQIVNGGFEAEIGEPWRFMVHESEGNMASLSRDTTDKAVGAASARIDVTAASGVDWHIHLSQYERSLEQGVTYDVSFWAKSDISRTITLGAQKVGGDWRNYGLHQQVSIDTDWKQYTVSFAANETANDARILFQVGETSSTVWLDEVEMTVHTPDVYQRKFTNGLVLLNGSQQPQKIQIGPGYRRLQGQQAPRYETILDDEGTAFSTTGTWTSMKYDSGELQATGPFYHCWQETCHERSGSEGEARWDLEIQAADTYTITAWWPAAPQADTWNQNVTYEVVVGEKVVASETLDQRSGGDEWHFVAAVPLSPNNINYVRMHCQGEAPCLADALHLRSQARYNDGSSAEQVTLQPLDGIILARSSGSDVYLPLVLQPGP